MSAARSFAPARRAQFDAGSQHRRSLLAKVHIAWKQLGMSEDDYRAVLHRHSGKLSAKEASDAQLIAVLAEFQAKGWQAIPKSGGKSAGNAFARRAPAADNPVARKARAMWLSLHQLGVVRNPSETALEAFACRQLGCTAMRWSDQSMGYRLIEALKSMAERNGWSHKVEGQEGSPDVRELRRRLCKAILDKMKLAGIVPDGWTVPTALYRLTGDDRLWATVNASSEDYAEAARQLGRVLRERAPTLIEEA